jgi:uncharacterized membrane protein
MSQSVESHADSQAKIDARVRQVELLISNLLRSSVLLSLVVIVIGTVVTFVNHPEFLSSRHALGGLLNPGTALPHTLEAVTHGLEALQGDAIVTLGLLLLIATPVVRVGISIFAFIYERDRVYTFITLTVFCLLILSFFLGKVE